MPTVIIIRVRLNSASESTELGPSFYFHAFIWYGNSPQFFPSSAFRNLLFSRKSERQTGFWIRKIIYLISVMVPPTTNSLILSNPFEIQCHEFLNENHDILLLDTYPWNVCHIPTPALGTGHTAVNTAQSLFQGINWEVDWFGQICRLFASIWVCSIKSEE